MSCTVDQLHCRIMPEDSDERRGRAAVELRRARKHMANHPPSRVEAFLIPRPTSSLGGDSLRHISDVLPFVVAKYLEPARR
jgi:hypothetical protein